jgi:hypothetical protein
MTERFWCRDEDGEGASFGGAFQSIFPAFFLGSFFARGAFPCSRPGTFHFSGGVREADWETLPSSGGNMDTGRFRSDFPHHSRSANSIRKVRCLSSFNSSVLRTLVYRPTQVSKSLPSTQRQKDNLGIERILNAYVLSRVVVERDVSDLVGMLLW